MKSSAWAPAPNKEWSFYWLRGENVRPVEQGVDSALLPLLRELVDVEAVRGPGYQHIV